MGLSNETLKPDIFLTLRTTKNSINILQIKWEFWKMLTFLFVWVFCICLLSSNFHLLTLSTNLTSIIKIKSKLFYLTPLCVTIFSHITCLTYTWPYRCFCPHLTITVDFSKNVWGPTIRRLEYSGSFQGSLQTLHSAL